MKDIVKIILVDDHDYFRKGLKLVLNSIQWVNVIAEAKNGLEFLNLLKSLSPDLVLMDIKMPYLDGIRATEIACSNDRYLNIIALTLFEEQEYFIQMMHAGAKGFVFKDTEKTEFKKAFKTVLSGRHYYSSTVTKKLLKDNIYLK
jgi:DNA-binding NarL/FixJ family response regulator